MVSVLDFGARDPGSRPGQRHFIVFLGRTLNSHSVSLHPAVQMGSGEFTLYCWYYPRDGLAFHPSWGGGVEIFLAASRYRNWNKLQLGEPLSSYVCTQCVKINQLINSSKCKCICLFLLVNE